MIDDNGGFILWIQSAFGPLAGWVNGYNALFTGLINLPICVVLITDYINVYLQAHDTQLSWVAGCVRRVVQNHNTPPLTSMVLPLRVSLSPTQHRFSIRIGVTVAVGLFNARGLGVVEKIETAMAFAVTVRVTLLPLSFARCPAHPPLTHVTRVPPQMPFLFLLFYLWGEDRYHLSASVDTPAPTDINWATFFCTMIWCVHCGRRCARPALAVKLNTTHMLAHTRAWMGWDGLGCMAGEVKNPGKQFPFAVIVVAVVNAVVYAMAVTVGASVASDLSAWKQGFFVQVANDAAGWLGVVVLISAIVSNAGLYQVRLDGSAVRPFAVELR